MARRLIGYRCKATRTYQNGTKESVYLSSCGNVRDVPPFFWSPNLRYDVLIPDRFAARKILSEIAKKCSVDMTREEIDLSDIRIVSVHLRTNEYESCIASKRVREDLSEQECTILDELERRNVSAYAEPKGLAQPSIQFRMKNGYFVWLPIAPFVQLDKPKKTRASRTVQLMLETLASFDGSKV